MANNPNLPDSEPPVVTVSQAKNLTDQGVHVTWSRFTPSLLSTSKVPNPGQYDALMAFGVSLFECRGTNPDFTDWNTVHSNCYVLPIGMKPPDPTWYQGPQNGLMAITTDGGAPPGTAVPSDVTGPYSAAWGYPDFRARQQQVHKSQPPLPAGTPASDCRYVTNADGTTSCYFNGGDPNTWTGEANFHIEAPTPRSQGGFFDCGPGKPCSLVVAPNWGGTPASGVGSGVGPGQGQNYSDTSKCNVHKYLAAGGLPGDMTGSASTPPYGAPDLATQSPGSLTGQSRACWAADRIVIPLSFASTPSFCPDKTPQFLAAGAPMMQLQFYQWTTSWCTGPGGLTVQYAANDESSTRDDFLAGGQVGGASTDMALVTLPADAAAQQGSSRKFTYAPMANTGTGIAFATDDGATGSQINRMVLSPRLLAKLTTQSYALEYGCGSGLPGQGPPPGQEPQPGQYCDPAVLKNWFSLFDDPEFQKLNRDCRPAGRPTGYICGDTTVHSADTTRNLVAYSDFPPDLGSTQLGLGPFLPTALSGQSDMTYDLTGLVAANSDAADFLHGRTDPWGMHVNNNYVGVPYPVQAFSVLDNGATNPADPITSCVQNPPTSSAPPVDCSKSTGFWDGTMRNSWNFQQDLNTIALDLAENQPTALSPNLGCPSPDITGSCDSTATLKNLGISAQYQGQRALTSLLDLGDIANYQFPAAEIQNASGTPVAPSQASVLAAVKDMKTNPDGITQYYDFASTDKKAYPLAMTDYAMVPTCGLSKSEASAIAEFLTRVATTGQEQGQAPGQLGQGYYPLTAAQKAQTLKAAGEVKAQDCMSPPPDTTISGHAGVDTTSATGGTGGAGGGASGSGANAAAKGAKAGFPAGTGAGTVPIGKARTAAFGQKSPDSGLAGWLILLVIIAGMVLLVGGPAAWVVTATGKWPVVARYARHSWAWAPPAWTRLRELRVWRP